MKIISGQLEKKELPVYKTSDTPLLYHLCTKTLAKHAITEFRSKGKCFPNNAAILFDILNEKKILEFSKEEMDTCWISVKAKYQSFFRDYCSLKHIPLNQNATCLKEFKCVLIALFLGKVTDFESLILILE